MNSIFLPGGREGPQPEHKFAIFARAGSRPDAIALAEIYVLPTGEVSRG